MKLGLFGRAALALTAALALGLSMTACGGGTVAFLWTFGSQYNQIIGYKVDDFSGNLTETLGSPYGIPDVNPTNMVVKVGGRYVYVLSRGTYGNPGTCTTANGTSAVGPGPCHATSSGVDLYSVGNDGVLTFQRHYDSDGYVPVWAQMDGTGSYLYVVDKYARIANCPTAQLSTNCGAGTTFNGSVTVFAADADTGRLSQVLNQQVKDPTDATGQTQLSYFPLGVDPIMAKSTGSCLLTIDGGDNTVFPYEQGSAGQLLLTQNTSGIVTGAAQLTSINGSGTAVYLTDANNGSATNYILPYTVTSGCSLSSVTGGKVQNATGTANPTNSLVVGSGNNQFLYVTNGFVLGNTTQANSSITAFNITPSTGIPVLLNDSPYSTGSGPNCIVVDPTNQWIYTSNYNDGTVTGKAFNNVTGDLSQLQHGSTFQATKQLSCLALSGDVD